MVAAAYQENYDRICADHLAEHVLSGHNPFQSEANWAALEEETAQLLRKHVRPGGRILDCGVAMGRLLACFPELDRHGVDIADGYLDHARNAGITAVHARIEQMPYPNGSFDYVVCTDVLEHVLDPNVCVAEMLRVLKPGGLLFVRVPHREELAPYLDSPYRFVHLRSFQEAELVLFFTRIFNCEIVETVIGVELGAVVRRP